MDIPFSIDYETSVLNLRHDVHSGNLVPVGMPSGIATGSLKPLYAFRHAKGDSTLFMTTGNFLFAMYLGRDGVQPQSVAVLPSEAKCAVATASSLIVMTQDGPFRIDYDADDMSWNVVGLLPEFPVIRLKAVNVSPVSVASKPVTLTGGYERWEGTLSDADEKALSGSLLDMYTQAATRAMQAGCFMQPVVARYQLFDRVGTLLYESAPVLVSAGDGFQSVNAFEASVVKDGASYSAVGAMKMEVSMFQVGFDVISPANLAWNNLVYSAKVIISPQLHPVDYNAQLSYRLETDADSSPLVRCFMPGTAVGMVPDSSLCCALVQCMAVRVNDYATLSRTITQPFNGGMSVSDFPLGKVVIPRVERVLPSEECHRLSALLGRFSSSVKEYSRALVDELAVPHRFTALTASAVGDIVVYGGVEPVRYSGYPVSMLACSESPGAWRACAVVTMSGGQEKVVWHGEGDSQAPLTLSPLLSYPAPDAVSMKITVSYADGEVRSRTVPLSAVCGVSLYISDDFKPLSLDTEEEAYVVPAAVNGQHNFPGAVVSASSAAPVRPVSALEITQGEIVAVTPAVRSLSSWDFARTHLYAFSTTGIYAVSVNAARSVIAANIIDARGVRSTQAVAVTDYGVCAIASSDLIHILGSRSATLDSDTAFETIGWCAAHQELWCASAAGEVSVRSSDGFYYRRDIVADEMLSVPDGRLYVLSGETLLDVAHEYAPESVSIEWCRRLRVKPFRPKSIMWHLSAADADVAMSLGGDNGAGLGSACSMLRLNVDGPVLAPVSGRVYAPPRHFLSLSFAGSVSPDACLSHISIK